MTDNTEPMSATVFEEAGRWWVRIWDDSGDVLSVSRTGWDGSGTFYNDGLNYVVAHLPKGFAYKGSGAWEQNEDGSYTVVLHRMDPRAR